MFRSHLGIKAKIALALAVFAISAASAIFFGLSLFKQLQTTLVEVTQHTVSDLEQTLIITRDSSEIRVLLEQLKRHPADDERHRIIQSLQSTWLELLLKTQQLEADETGKNNASVSEAQAIQHLLQDISLLQQLSKDLFQIRQKKQQQLARLVESQWHFNRHLRPLLIPGSEDLNRDQRPLLDSSNPDGLFHLYIAAADLMTLLLQTESVKQSAALNQLMRQQLQQQNTILSISTRIPAALKPHVARWLEQLTPLVSSKNSLVSLQRQQLRLASTFDRQLQRHSRLAATVEQQAEKRTFALNNVIQQNTHALNRSIDRYKWQMVLGLSSGFVISATIAWLTLMRAVISPLLATRKAMIRISQGDTETELPAFDRNEIGEMLKALKTLRDYVRQVQQLSKVDSLTGLYNRRFLDEQLLLAVNQQKQHHTPLAMVMLDIDFFKQYNDFYGHIAGDRCLMQIAKLIQQEFQRSIDTCARYGGEEFVVVLPDTDLEAALNKAHVLRTRVIEANIPHQKSPCHDRVTVSIGVLGVDLPNQRSAQELLDLTDRCLYLAKGSGRNTIRSSRTATTKPLAELKGPL